MKKKLLSVVFVLSVLGYIVSSGALKPKPTPTPAPARSDDQATLESSVVYIVNKNETTGGTGFHVKTATGNKYIITNSHVCEGTAENGTVYVKFKEDERPTPRRVIEESQLTDLCIVEAMPKGIPMILDDSDPTSFQTLKAAGHPDLMPLTITDGRVVGAKQIEIPLFLGTDNCDAPKHKKGHITMFMFPIEACFLNIKAIATTVQIMGGSSGSPMLNEQGRVAGVAFASNSQLGWAIIIPVTDLHKFLSKY